MNIQDMKESRFLTQKEVEPAVCWTIKRVEQVDVAKPGADPEYRWAVFFKEYEKPMTLNTTNAQEIAEITGSEETDDWPGTLIVLYRDKNVMYAGKKVGGIRVRPPKEGYKPPQTEPEIPDDDVPF